MNATIMAHRRRGVGVNRKQQGILYQEVANLVRVFVWIVMLMINDDTRTSTGNQNYHTLQYYKWKRIQYVSLVDGIEWLQIKLTDIAKTCQAEIQDDPALRQQLLQLCALLGIDLLVSQKGFWYVRVSCLCME